MNLSALKRIVPAKEYEKVEQAFNLISGTIQEKEAGLVGLTRRQIQSAPSTKALAQVIAWNANLPIPRI